MKGLKDIDKIKQSFEAMAAGEKAPADLWNAISNELDHTALEGKVKDSFTDQQFTAPSFDFNLLNPQTLGVDELVNKSFEQTQVAAPEQVWEKIQDGLETDLVWERMANNITVGSNKWQAVLMAASVALLFALVPYHVTDEGVNKMPILTESVQLFASLSNETVTSDEQTVLLADQSNEVNSVVEDAQEIQFDEIETVQLNGLEGESETITADQLAVATIDYLDKPQVEELDVTLSLQEPELHTIEPIQGRSKWSFNVGLIGGLNNTWIMDNEIRASFDRETLYDSKFTLGEYYGVFGEAWINDKHAITTNVIVNSSSRSKLGYYDNGEYKIRRAQIDYSKISLLYGHKFSFAGKKRDINVIVRGGPYAGWNRRSFVTEDDVLVSFNSNYKKFDYGLKLQLGQQYEWSNFVLGYGVNSEIGLRNIFKGNGYVSPELNYTNKMDIGLYLSLAYKLK